MKTVLIFLIFVSLQATELQWVDAQIQAIKPPRIGLKATTVAKIKDPFIFTKSTKVTKKKSLKIEKIYHAKHYSKRYPLSRLHLSMTMNTSAKINGKWYKVGDVLHRYIITSIQLSSVTLRYHKRSYILSTRSTKPSSLHIK